MKKLAVLLCMILWVSYYSSAQDWIYIGGQVTDIETGAAVPNHEVFAAFSDSLLFATFQTNEDGYYGDTIYMGGMIISSAYIFTYDCLGLIHDTLVTGFNAPVIVNFSICWEIIPPDCQSLFVAFPDSSDFLTWYFMDMSTTPNGPSGWLWNFGDGATSEEQNPVHTYAEEGLYMVCLTIADDTGSCYDVYCDSLYIPSFPGGDCENFFTYITNDNLTFFFTGQVNTTDPTDYHWDFGDGTTALGKEVEHTFDPAPGIAFFNVCLQTLTTDSTGDVCEAVSCQEVWIGNPVECQAMFFYYPFDSLLGGLTYQFVDISWGIHDTWFWEFGDGTSSTEQNPQHTFGNGGAYFVCLSISDSSGACNDTFCENVFIDTIPPPGCETFFYWENADTLTFTFYGEAWYNGIPVTADYYFWDFGDGTTGEGEIVTHTYDQPGPGTYLVCLTTTFTDPTGISCTATNCAEIWVNNYNYLSLYGQAFAGNTPVDYGLATLFAIEGGIGNVFPTYISLIDSLGHFGFDYVMPGSYYLLAELLPESAYYDLFLPTYYGDVLYWEDATIITLGNPQNPYNINMIAAGTMQSGPGIISGQISLGEQLFRDGVPLSDAEILLLDENPSAIAYRFSSTEGTFEFPALDYGTYHVYAEIPGKTTSPATVSIDEINPHAQLELVVTQHEVNVLSINDQDITAFVIREVYPNPVKETISIAVTLTRYTALNICILNLMGQKVNEKIIDLDAGYHTAEINLAGIPAGIYILRISCNEGMVSRRFVKSD